jgi:hypothetical protein
LNNVISYLFGCGSRKTLQLVSSRNRSKHLTFVKNFSIKLTILSPV